MCVDASNVAEHHLYGDVSGSLDIQHSQNKNARNVQDNDQTRFVWLRRSARPKGGFPVRILPLHFAAAAVTVACISVTGARERQALHASICGRRQLAHRQPTNAPYSVPSRVTKLIALHLYRFLMGEM